MPDYWKNPPRRHIIAFLIERYPDKAAQWRRAKIAQLRAIWRRINTAGGL
jgi:hypothetical protein